MSKLNWKNIISLLVVIGLIALLVYVFLLYNHIEQTRTDYYDETKKWILAETDMKTIDHIYHYQGEMSYYILKGENSLGEKWLVFNPGKNKTPDKIEMFKIENLVDQDQIEKEWQSTCNGCTLKKSSPAMMDEIPLWELTYLDENNRYVMEYMSLKDGSTYEKLKLHRKYTKKG